MMHLSISAQYTLKNRTPEYRGITSEHVTFGKDRPSSLAEMCMSLLEYTFDWYCITEDAESLNADRKLLSAWLSGIHFTDNDAEARLIDPPVPYTAEPEKE